MYKIYLNDNNNQCIKNIFNKLEKKLDKYIVHRNNEEINNEHVIEDCNNIKPNMYISININKEKVEKIYCNKNNSYSHLMYNILKKEFQNNKILIEYSNENKKEIVNIFSPCVCLELNKKNCNDELIYILEKSITKYFIQGEI